MEFPGTEEIKKSLLLKIAVARYNIVMKPTTAINYLKPGQVQTLFSIKQKDTIAILPTGYGKSLIYELLPFVYKAFYNADCLVVIAAPLNVIIRQVVQKLQHSILFTDSMDNAQKKKLQKGEFIYIIGHPEDLLSDWGLDFFRSMRLSDKVFIVIDEVHCIIEWGVEFRPKYGELIHLKTVFPNNTILALTATASSRDKTEIIKQLNLQDPTVLNTSPILNSNIKLSVKTRPQSTGLHHFVENSYDAVFKPLLEDLFMDINLFPKTLVYTKLQWCGYAYELSKRLQGKKFFHGEPLKTNQTVAQFHSPQKQEVNSFIIDQLKTENSPLKLVFATIALGMGADLRLVRRVIHAGPPCTLEAYIQEIGRAGRDGSPSTAQMFCNASDIGANLKHVEDAVRKYVRNKSQCRRKLLSEHFSTVFESVAPSNCCDICDNTVSSEIMKKPPLLEHREMVKGAIIQYVLSDNTGQLTEIVTEENILRISETFELIADENHIMVAYGFDLTVATSIFNIISKVFSFLQN